MKKSEYNSDNSPGILPDGYKLPGYVRVGERVELKSRGNLQIFEGPISILNIGKTYLFQHLNPAETHRSFAIDLALVSSCRIRTVYDEKRGQRP